MKMYAWRMEIHSSRVRRMIRMGVMDRVRIFDEIVKNENMNIMICPEERLVERRIISVNGRMMCLKISINGRMIIRADGAP